MKKFFQHLQSYSLEHPQEIKKMVLGFIFFFGCSLILYSNAGSSWFLRLVFVFSLSMTLVTCFSSLVGLYTLFWVRPRFRTKVLPKLLDQMQIKEDEKILDLGSDRGLLPLLMTQKLSSGKVTTVFPKLKKKNRNFWKIKRKMNAKKFRDKVEVQCCDFSRLPFPDHHFDRVTSTLFFHSLPSEQEELVLEEVLRVLKPGASFIFFDLISGQSRYLNREMHQALKDKEKFSLETLSFEFYLKYTRKEKVYIGVQNSSDFPRGRTLMGENKLLEESGKKKSQEAEYQRAL